jgi:uncharacterized protein
MRFPRLVVAFLMFATLFSQAALSADETINATAPKASNVDSTAVENNNDAIPEVLTFPLPQPDGAGTGETQPIVVPVTPRRIALLLPLKSATFGHAADAVKEGFLAASQIPGAEPSAPIEIYDSEEGSKNLLPIYNRVLTDNVSVVVGPMTRSEVTTIVRSGMVTAPTIALNVPENDSVAPPPLFYSLSLSQENEARQLANIAFTRGLRRAAIVTTSGALPKRIHAAFADEWLKLGATTTLEFPYSADQKLLADFRIALKAQLVDVVFIATDANIARKIRPYIRASLPTFATSQLFRSKNDSALNMDLKDVQFVDMPWLIAPDHAAVMVYPQPKKSMTAELQRFYALGIDAYRLAQILLRGEPFPAEPIDGVSGRISLTSGHWFSRELLPATFDATGAAKPITP